MSEQLSTAPQGGRSIVTAMAERYGMEAGAFKQTLLATVMPRGSTMENVAAFLVVAKEHNLNPFTREIFAFPDAKSGGVRPIVSVDGWARILNDHPKFDGCELVECDNDKGDFVAVRCSIWRKDRSRPFTVTEYLNECSRNTEPWQRWPRRMLRHKALIQCARLAFSFSGIIDEDEYEREVEAQVVTTQTAQGERRLVIATPSEPSKTIDLASATSGEAIDPPGGSPVAQAARKAPAKAKGAASAKVEPDASQALTSDELYSASAFDGMEDPG
jgi:phage recombination protein Bet